MTTARKPSPVRRQSLGPLEDDEPHCVPPPTAPVPPAKPQIDAYKLVDLWRRARMVGDVANERCIMAELERLATRPKTRTGGEHNEQHG